MSADRGPLMPYEIVWRSGHVERIEAHQVLWPSRLGSLFGESPDPDPRVMFHGEVNGHWMLLLAADPADILSVRALTSEQASS